MWGPWERLAAVSSANIVAVCRVVTVTPKVLDPQLAVT
jgi:hypothetical protein